MSSSDVDAALSALSRSGAQSTADLLAALAPLAQFGLDAQAAALIGMGHFPVAGPAVYRDDWHDPRMTPTYHLHQGTDIFAAFDTPVRAPFDGVVSYAEEGAGGKAAYVRTADGTIYYMAHLNGFGPPAGGSSVRQGDVVGYVGDSGNARGGAPHVHLQVHPGGGAPVNPKPRLDAWLAEALAAAPTIVARYRAAVPPVAAETQARLMRSFDRARRDNVSLAYAAGWDPTELLVAALLAPLTPWQMSCWSTRPGLPPQCGAAPPVFARSPGQ
jgi:hypothetical protein